jgi:hypothetical protein
MWFECDIKTSDLRWPSTSMIAYDGDRSFIATNAGWRWDGRISHPNLGHQQRRQRARQLLGSRAQRDRLRKGLFEGSNRRLVSETMPDAVRHVPVACDGSHPLRRKAASDDPGPWVAGSARRSEALPAALGRYRQHRALVPDRTACGISDAAGSQWVGGYLEIDLTPSAGPHPQPATQRVPGPSGRERGLRTPFSPLRGEKGRG